MKLLPKNTRVNREDSLGHGMDAVIMLLLFFLAGWGLDSVFGTTPVFMIVLTVLAAVGLFAKFFYRYKARMEEHEQRRRERSASSHARDRAA